MRSRFCAFARQNHHYLQQSWHPDTRPATLSLSEAQQWLGLDIVSSETRGDRGRVHFRAIGRTGGDWFVLEEHANFLHENGHWYYVDGRHQSRPLKPGRNDTCPCGSGRKFKKCCGD